MKLIKGRGFILRPQKITDAKMYLETHDALGKKGFMAYPKDLVESKKEIKENIEKSKAPKSKRERLSFTIEVRGEPAGFLTLHWTLKPRYKHQAIIGFGIHPNFRGQGLASKACKTVCNYAFKELGLVKITGYCRTFNKASAKTMKKAGFVLEGILKKNKFHNGKYLDDMIWSKFK